jgi:hypothetical protein
MGEIQVEKLMELIDILEGTIKIQKETIKANERTIKAQIYHIDILKKDIGYNKELMAIYNSYFK